MINSKTEISTTNPLLRKAMYEAFDGRCFYTGRCLLFQDIHIDHIVPVNKGGKNCIENYVLCSQYINSKKQDSYTDDFGKVAVEINKLLFCNKVILVYRSLIINDSLIKDEYNYSVDLYCKENNIDINSKNKILFILRKNNKVQSKKFIKTTGIISSKNKLYSNIDELDKAFNLIK